MKLKKFRGQHLLTDTNMISKIVDTAGVAKGDSVIEIGAGTGILTRALARTAGRVISFEIDRDFRETLAELQEEFPGLSIRIEDFLQFPLLDFLSHSESRWRIVANIPYNITSPIIEKIINERHPNLIDSHLLMQKEVARRMVAPPGGKDYGRLSVFVQYFCNAKILLTVPPEVFTPPPQVESALLRMECKEDVGVLNSQIFFAVVKAAFEMRRKQLGNTLKNVAPGLSGDNLEMIFKKSNIDRQRRGETLSLEEFATIARVVDDYLKEKKIVFVPKGD